MQAKIIKKSDGQVVFTSSADSEFMRPIKNKVIKEQSKDIKIPGFRAGKVPAEIAEKQLDQRALQSHVLDHTLGELYYQAVKQLDLRPIGNPKIEIKKFVPFAQLEAEITCAVMPQIKLPDYKKIRLPINFPEASVDDINGVLASLRRRMAERKAVSRPAAKGDEVVIDFSGTDQKGQPVKGADAKDYQLILGSNTFIPGFEDNLLGQGAGKELSFKLRFPKDYGVKALANRHINFKVSIKHVNELKEPALDDKFAAKAGPFKTLADLKDDIKKQLSREKQMQAEHDYEERLIKDITSKAKLIPPPLLIEEQIERDLNTVKQNLDYRGQTLKEYLADQQLSEDDYVSQSVRPAAAEKVKGALVLSAIADAENLTVSNEELEEYINQLKLQYQNDAHMQAEINKPANRRDLAGRLLSRKTINQLKQYSLANS